jgi:hypothetical protein
METMHCVELKTLSEGCKTLVSGIFAHGRIGMPNDDVNVKMSSATVRVRPTMTGCDQLSEFSSFPFTDQQR